jgi:hypothetical protein
VTFKRTFGYHPLLVFCDNMLRPGNAEEERNPSLRRVELRGLEPLTPTLPAGSKQASDLQEQ